LKKIALHGMSEIKQHAASRAALRFSASMIRLRSTSIELQVTPVDVSDALPVKQPIGLDETRLGAQGRARLATILRPEDDYGLGVENGIMFAGGGFWPDLAFVALMRKSDGHTIYTTSLGIPCPPEDVVRVIGHQQQRTAGSFIAARTGCASVDWQHHATGGLLEREGILADAIYAAFAIEFHNCK